MEPNWISSKDKLPPKKTIVLTKHPNGQIVKSWIVMEKSYLTDNGPWFAHEGESMDSGGGWVSDIWASLPKKSKE